MPCILGGTNWRLSVINHSYLDKDPTIIRYSMSKQSSRNSLANLSAYTAKRFRARLGKPRSRLLQQPVFMYVHRTLSCGHVVCADHVGLLNMQVIFGDPRKNKLPSTYHQCTECKRHTQTNILQVSTFEHFSRSLYHWANQKRASALICDHEAADTVAKTTPLVFLPDQDMEMSIAEELTTDVETSPASAVVESDLQRSAPHIISEPSFAQISPGDHEVVEAITPTVPTEISGKVPPTSLLESLASLHLGMPTGSSNVAEAPMVPPVPVAHGPEVIDNRALSSALTALDALTLNYKSAPAPVCHKRRAIAESDSEDDSVKERRVRRRLEGPVKAGKISSIPYDTTSDHLSLQPGKARESQLSVSQGMAPSW